MEMAEMMLKVEKEFCLGGWMNGRVRMGMDEWVSTYGRWVDEWVSTFGGWLNG